MLVPPDVLFLMWQIVCMFASGMIISRGVNEYREGKPWLFERYIYLGMVTGIIGLLIGWYFYLESVHY